MPLITVNFKYDETKVSFNDVNDEDLISNVISPLISTHFDIPINSQKLIYSGRILDPSKTLNDYNFKNDHCIILISNIKKDNTQIDKNNNALTVQHQNPIPRENIAGEDILTITTTGPDPYNSGMEYDSNEIEHCLQILNNSDTSTIDTLLQDDEDFLHTLILINPHLNHMDLENAKNTLFNDERLRKAFTNVLFVKEQIQLHDHYKQNRTPNMEGQAVVVVTTMDKYGNLVSPTDPNNEIINEQHRRNLNIAMEAHRAAVSRFEKERANNNDDGQTNN